MTSDGGATSSSPLSLVRSVIARDRRYDGLTFISHMIAGAIAGTVEHTAMYPVDTIKTRMQALGHPGQRLHRLSLAEALRTALKREGIAGLYKGVGAVAAGAGPAHAMHFAVYELAKEGLGGNRGSTRHHPAIAAFSGALATVVNEVVMTPVDLVKQRLQVAHSPYKGALDCVVTVAKTEGLSAFFRAYKTSLVMSVPFQAIHFAMYEGVKKILLNPTTWQGQGQEVSSSSSSINLGEGKEGEKSESGSGSPAAVEDDEDDLEDNLMTQLIAGGIAGGVAAALTTPFDVVKTRIQTELPRITRQAHPPSTSSTTQPPPSTTTPPSSRSTAVLPMMRRIVAEEGWGALWRGLQPRILFNVPAAAVCWGMYETIKSLLES